MRCVALACLLAACGDNADSCGFVDPIETYRNIWSLQLAVDATHVYFSDYDVDGDGTQLVIAEPHAGGPIDPVGIRPPASTFGRGLAVNERYVFWASTNEEAASSFFASPLDGGSTLLLAPLPACAPSGITYDADFLYAGTLSCEDGSSDVIPSSVVAVDRDAGTGTTVWTSAEGQGDVRDLATGGGALFIATSTGVYALRGTALELLDGHPGRHVEVHDETLYYSTDEGIFELPVTGGDRVRHYTYPADATEIGSFALDGTDLYFAESGHMYLAASIADAPRMIVENLGRGVGPIVARDGWAYWSVLFVPEVMGNDFDTFAGGVFRVLRPCD